jgi:hypothetical protein
MVGQANALIAAMQPRRLRELLTYKYSLFFLENRKSDSLLKMANQP